MLAVVILAAALFPSPLHLTREVSDPITGSKTVVDEYCQGNRVVSVIGKRTAIAEYDARTITTIDFEAGTYSVATFDELAKAWGGSEAKGAVKPNVRITADRRISLNREAAEVLLGIAYPARPADGSETMLQSLRVPQPRVAGDAADAGAPLYALPSEQIVELDTGDGEPLQSRSVVVRVGSEAAPLELLAIPSGARRVEAKALALRRILEELDGQR